MVERHFQVRTAVAAPVGDPGRDGAATVGVVLYLGLSGGIGSGKSTVSARFAELGAVVIDADRLARDVVQPGGEGLAQIVARFGTDVLLPDGSLNRPALGAIVFAEERARRDLEKITHPRVQQLTTQLRRAAPREAIVVHDVPLLVEAGLAPDHHLSVIVDAAEEVRAERLTTMRGMAPEEASSRIAAQATDAQRYAVADVLLDNNGTRDALLEQVDSLWQERLSPYNDNLLAARGAPSGPPARVEPDTPQAARTIARVRRQLDQAGLGDRVVSSRMGPGGVLVVQLQAADADDATLRSALLAAGFAAGVGPSDYAACDPAAPLSLEVRRVEAAAVPPDQPRGVTE